MVPQLFAHYVVLSEFERRIHSVHSYPHNARKVLAQLQQEDYLAWIEEWNPNGFVGVQF